MSTMSQGAPGHGDPAENPPYHSSHFETMLHPNDRSTAGPVWPGMSVDDFVGPDGEGARKDPRIAAFTNTADGHPTFDNSWGPDGSALPWKIDEYRKWNGPGSYDPGLNREAHGYDRGTEETRSNWSRTPMYWVPNDVLYQASL
eukprot:SAG22_NODE_10875_length_512_cov_0.987893_1_plen_143_part_01